VGTSDSGADSEGTDGSPSATRTPNSGLRLPRPGCVGDRWVRRRTRKLSSGCCLPIYYMIFRKIFGFVNFIASAITSFEQVN
jgi:hypothetical protein